MQELFPEEADQAHYLTVMINRWAWRTPSPGRDAATPTPTPPMDEDAVITRCGTVSGEGEGLSLGQGTESAGMEMSVPTGNFAFDKEEDLVAGIGGAEELWVTEDFSGALQACGPCPGDSAVTAEGAAGADGGTVEDGEGCLEVGSDDDFTIVVNVDSSRAASLTRTCRWAGYKKLPDGCELTVAELREMANRQQQQIETQQQLLVAREQRLKFLKQQENRQQQVAAEAERLRRLRERVEAQELKLRKLRALRGQVDNHRLNTSTLTNDLEAMRALFSEKEKELVLAVAKVEELTHQLEDLRNGRSNLHTNNQHHNELDKLRRELLYHNSVNREASARVASQRETLSARREEITRIDKRIAELQQRLHRKRLLNQQLASQITAATQAKQAHLKAVQQKAIRDGSPAEDAHTHDHLKVSPGEDLGEFGPNKHDPKYQTLPYNTKFSVTFKTKQPMGGESGDSAPPTPTTPVPPPFPGAPPPHQENQGGSGGVVPPLASVAASSCSSTGGSTGVVTQTVHSIPTHPPSRGHALAPPQPQQTAQQPPTTQQGSNSTHTAPPQLKPASTNAMTPRVYGPGAAAFNLTASRSQPLGATTTAQDTSRPLLPPTSLSVSFGQKLSPSVTAQSRQLLLPAHYSQDVENVRALGGSSTVLSSNSNNNSSSNHHSSNSSLNNLHQSDGGATDDAGEVGGGGSGGGGGGGGGTSLGRAKPALPPKPTVPSKPLPPPRQKGDNSLGGSTESLPGAGAARTPQVKGPQPYRYASQNVIMSTYTQQPSTSSLESSSSSTTTTTITTSTSTATPTSSSSSSTSCSNNEASEDKNSKQLNNNNIIVNNNNNQQQVSGVKESGDGEKVHVSISRRIEMPPDFMFPEDETPPSDLLGRRVEEIDPPPNSGTPHHHHLHHNHHHQESSSNNNNNNNNNSGESQDVVDRAIPYSEMEKLRLKDDSKGGKGGFENAYAEDSRQPDGADTREPHEEGRTGESDRGSGVVRRIKKGNLRTKNSAKVTRRVSFDPLALLLDASLEGELELVKRTAMEVPNPSAANDEGITALHNAICAGHLDIVTFLVTFGCDVNAQDSDGWTPLHCAASCNNVAMVRFLVEHGACILATTLSDHETAAEKCEQDEEGYDGCSQYLYSVQEKLGIMNGGVVYGVYEYQALAADELSFNCGDAITILRRGDEYEREWWWGQLLDKQGYVPRNLLGLYPRVTNPDRDT